MVKKHSRNQKAVISSWKSYFLIAFFVSSMVACLIYQNELKFVYLKIKSNYIKYINKHASKTEQDKINKIIKHYNDALFGIDISQYQEIINWNRVKYLEDSIPIYFVLIRATAGKDKEDNYFTYNWREAKANNILRGAYHYYRPNENSKVQAENFIQKVSLESGDILPVLDIEEEAEIQSISSLRKGIRNWLRLIEDAYGVKPIIYTGDSFYQDYLKGKGFDEYPIWIANYNKKIIHPKYKDWLIWQFSDKGKVNGINSFVDLNVFDGNSKHFEFLLIK